MIIDSESPDPPSRRWPFLAGWCCTAITIVLALFFSHNPLPQQPAVTISTSPAPSASAVVSRSVILQEVSAGPYSVMQRVDGNRGLGTTVILEYHLLTDDRRGSTTNLR
jgi:hypothetical protein